MLVQNAQGLGSLLRHQLIIVSEFDYCVQELFTLTIWSDSSGLFMHTCLTEMDSQSHVDWLEKGFVVMESMMAGLRFNVSGTQSSFTEMEKKLGSIAAMMSTLSAERQAPPSAAPTPDRPEVASMIYTTTVVQVAWITIYATSSSQLSSPTMLPPHMGLPTFDGHNLHAWIAHAEHFDVLHARGKSLHVIFTNDEELISEEYCLHHIWMTRLNRSYSGSRFQVAAAPLITTFIPRIQWISYDELIGRTYEYCYSLYLV